LFPGLSGQIASAEIGTPLSNLHYRNATEGCIYGTAKTRGQVGPFAWPVRTGIPGLWMCGASTLIHGALGASTSGLHAAASVLGCRMHELLSGSGRVRTMPAEDPSSWPADLRAIVELKERGVEATAG
jgi:all-trans-retinol 13,14-reductase